MLIVHAIIKTKIVNDLTNYTVKYRIILWFYD